MHIFNRSADAKLEKDMEEPAPALLEITIIYC